MTRKVLRLISCYLLFNFAALAYLVLIDGIWPRTLIGWCLVANLGLPLLATCKWVGRRVAGERVSKWIDPSPQRVSLRRMGYLLLLTLLLIAVWLGVWTAIRPWVEPHVGSWHRPLSLGNIIQGTLQRSR